MNSLLWKAVARDPRLLAIFIAWMTIAVCYAIGYELGHHVRAVVGHFSGLALFYSLFAAVVLAMRTSHGERTDGTIAFSAALPISMRRIGTVRIVSAVATLAHSHRDRGRHSVDRPGQRARRAGGAAPRGCLHAIAATGYRGVVHVPGTALERRGDRDPRWR